MRKMLIVDDSDLNRDILGEIFEEDYEILKAGDGEEAITVINREKDGLSIIFLDLMMPKKNGLEVLAYLNEVELIDELPVIMITGEATAESDMKAYEYGAADIIYKPFVSKVVRRRASNLVEQYESRRRMEAELEKRSRALARSHKQLESTNEALLDALGSVVEFRSLESGEHIRRVKKYTRILLRYLKNVSPEYKLSKHEIELISKAAALHDVGKIAIPDAILNAPRKLTEEEYAEMQKHTIYGCELLERFKFDETDFYKYCYEICRWHHERADGRGYPDHLTEKEIPIYCQVVGIADCFDALVSKRVYKASLSCEEAYVMILRGECGEFSENIKKCFGMAKAQLFKVVEETKDETEGML